MQDDDAMTRQHIMALLDLFAEAGAKVEAAKLRDAPASEVLGLKRAAIDRLKPAVAMPEELAGSVKERMLPAWAREWSNTYLRTPRAFPLIARSAGPSPPRPTPRGGNIMKRLSGHRRRGGVGCVHGVAGARCSKRCQKLYDNANNRGTVEKCLRRLHPRHCGHDVRERSPASTR